MKLITRPVGSWGMNAYVLICPQTKASVLIDPGADPHTLEEMLAGTQPIAILVTHSHMDHIGALDEMRRQLDVPVMAHPGKGDGRDGPADRWLAGGERLAVGNGHLVVYPTPGHTADQVCFGVENSNIFIVGDTIFEGGPGKTWSCQEFQTSLETLKKVVLAWPDDAVCYPGHGSAFRLGDQRGAIEKFLKKDHGAFFGDAQWTQG